MQTHVSWNRIYEYLDSHWCLCERSLTLIPAETVVQQHNTKTISQYIGMLIRSMRLGQQTDRHTNGQTDRQTDLVGVQSLVAEAAVVQPSQACSDTLHSNR